MNPFLERRKKMKKEISARLKALRNQFGFTQEQISRVLGIDRSGYSYMESGKVMPSINALLAFSKMYGMSVDDLLGRTPVSSMSYGAKDPFALTKDEKTLLLCYRIGNERKQKRIFALISDPDSRKTEN